MFTADTRVMCLRSTMTDVEAIGCSGSAPTRVVLQHSVCVCVCVCVSLCVCVCHCVSEWTEKVPGQYVDGTLKASQMVERGRLREIGHSVVMCVCVCVCVCALRNMEGCWIPKRYYSVSDRLTCPCLPGFISTWRTKA